MKEQKRREKKWSLQYQRGNPAVDAEIAALARGTGYSPIMAKLLYTRGYRTPEEAEAFFHQESACLHDPFLLCDILPAVERIEAALAGGERIAIYGDYDVDGVTSVSLLYLYLKSRGGDVDYYIPSRMKEGYGLSAPAIDTLAQNGVKLMITVDTGVTAIDEIAYASSLGIDTVVTDHHECRATLPDAVAVVNPHRADDAYPFKELAGVGVVFKLISACEISLCRRAGKSERQGIARICREYADLVALGTIADVMPVVDENRLIVTLGLARIENTERPGLRALIEAASTGSRADGSKIIKKRAINSSFIGFTIAPRMNAAGRVSSASIAAELLLAEDRTVAEGLAEQLCELNTLRQGEENRIAEEAYKKIEQTLDAENDRVIVIDDDGWQQGIIGIVSSRITERYGLPSILISFDGTTDGAPSGDDVGKGSGRSVKGLNLVEALTDSEDLLERFGGHELAAGLSIRRSNIDAFRRKINRYAAQHLSEEMLCVCLDADCEVELDELSMHLAEEIGQMEPFGISNPVPSFVLRNARISRMIPMAGGKHLRLLLEKGGREITAVWFGTGPSQIPFAAGDCVDLLFQLNINDFQGTRSLQLILQDMKYADEFEAAYRQSVLRYEAVYGGATHTESERLIPTRDDIAAVYTLLRREYRAGASTFSMRRLIGMIASERQLRMGYCKLKYILRIMQELNICRVGESEPDVYVFGFDYRATKTNIEKSSILRRLKMQLQRD